MSHGKSTKPVKKTKTKGMEDVGFEHDFEHDFELLKRGAPLAVVTVTLHRATGTVSYNGSQSTPLETVAMLDKAAGLAVFDYEVSDDADDLEEA